MEGYDAAAKEAAEEALAADLKAGHIGGGLGNMEGGFLGGSCKSYPFLIRMYFLFASVFNSGVVSILVLSLFRI